MKKLLPNIISIIFISSTILLVFSLPQCGHGGFQLGLTTHNSGVKSCNGNIYDHHIAFLQTIFLTRFEWILSFILLLLASLALPQIIQYFQNEQSIYLFNKLSRYFSRMSKPFDRLAPVYCTGRIYQRLLE